MTKQEIYRELCIEAGTYTGNDANEWYDLCSHNIHRGLDAALELAAAGDVAAIAECRQECGLPILV